MIIKLGLFALLLSGPAALAQWPASLVPQVSLFLTAVPPTRGLVLRLRRWTGTGYLPVDSVRLVADGPLLLTDRTAGADPTRPALYEVALDKYARTEVVLRPGELPHGAATVPQLARQGVYWEDSPENTAYQRTLAEVRELDAAIARATEALLALPDSATRARQTATQALEHRHRALAAACAQEPLRYAPPGSFAQTVLGRVARYPTRPDSLAGRPGYLAWLGPALAADFPLATDEALRHYVGAARLGLRLWQLGPLLPGGPALAAGALLARRQGHDAVNAWLWTALTHEGLAHDDAVLLRQMRLDYGGPDACVSALPPALAAQLADMQGLEPGQPGPLLTLPDSLGQPRALADCLRQHRYTLFYGWVSWCHTCQAEAPRLRALLARVGPARLGVYAVSLDEVDGSWRGALRAHGPAPAGWLDVAERVPLAHNTAARRYHVRLTPKLVLLDQRGRIVGRYASVAELAAALPY